MGTDNKEEIQEEKKKGEKFKRTPKEEPQKLNPNEILELVEMEQELYELKKEQGLINEKKGIKKFTSTYFEKKEPRKLSVVNKRKYLYFLLFTGWCGGHQFYAKRYNIAWLYLIFFWTGFPTAMAIADWVVWLPKKPDENGNIEI